MRKAGAKGRGQMPVRGVRMNDLERGQMRAALVAVGTIALWLTFGVVIIYLLGGFE